MEKLKTYRKLIVFHIFMNVCFVIFCTGSSYYHVPLKGFEDRMMYFMHLITLQISVAGIFYFLSLHKWLFRILFSSLYILYGIIGFWVYSLDVSMSNSLINATLQSKFYIIKDLLTPEFFAYIFGLLFSLFLIHRLYNKCHHRQGIKFFGPLSFLCFMVYFIIENKRANTFKSRLPYQLIFALKEYTEEPKMVLRHIPKGTYSSDIDVLNVVMVVGESVRADHLGINGYERNTTPQLAKVNNCVSYKNLYTNKTYTAISLPQMFTNQSIYEVEGGGTQSLFSTLNNAGIYTSWIGNQLLEKNYRGLMKTNTFVEIIDELKYVTSFHKLRDEALLPFLEKACSTTMNSTNKSLTSLHMIGSHWWFESRYDDAFRKYTPVIASKHIPALNKEHIVNSYDNTILYLDHFLVKVIEQLKRSIKPTVMIYVSDHGESLGENGHWLHAHGDDIVKNPACIVWYSDSFEAAYPEKVSAIRLHTETSVTMDFLYYSVLDLFEINEVKESSIFYCKN